MRRSAGIASAVLALGCGGPDAISGSPAVKPSVPVVGACWPIAGVPVLGAAFDNAGQQPVDFGLWQAADGSWQVWSCTRGTKEEGQHRVFHHWEGSGLQKNATWAPKGIAMRAGRVTPDGTPGDGTFDTSFGEKQGGLQAPYVWRDGTTWHMVYGTWFNLGEQISSDGKAFARVPRKGNDVTIFEPANDGKRDPMMLLVGGVQYLYFTAGKSVYLSTSNDGKAFSAAKEVASGGQAGTGGSAAECPFVVHRDDGYYYLFRTSSEKAPSNYGPGVMTYVYASTDPGSFGVDDDSRLVAALPVAAPEIHTVDGKDYMARLLESVKGIQICDLSWQPYASH